MDLGAGTVRKAADTPSERRRLGREASVLRAGAHPGIVQLLEVQGSGDPEALVLRRVDGSPLSERRDLSPAELAALGAAVATTVADLHDVGFVHLSLNPSHVLIDESNRPVLCGFGSARYAAGCDEHEEWRRRDVMALARLLLDSAGDAGGPKQAAVLRWAASGREHRWFRRHPTDARQIARSLATAAASVGDDRRARRHRLRSRGALSRRRAVQLLAGAAAAAGGMAAAGAVWPAGDARSSVGAGTDHGKLTALAEPCPTQDAGCLPVPTPHGMVGVAYRIVGADGVVVLGRWDCRAGATPAILDPATGNLWVFDSWPGSGAGVKARLVVNVPGGTSLKVVPRLNSSCDRIEVRDRNGVLRVADPLGRT